MKGMPLLQARLCGGARLSWRLRAARAPRLPQLWRRSPPAAAGGPSLWAPDLARTTSGAAASARSCPRCLPGRPQASLCGCAPPSRSPFTFMSSNKTRENAQTDKAVRASAMKGGRANCQDCKVGFLETPRVGIHATADVGIAPRCLRKLFAAHVAQAAAVFCMCCNGNVCMQSALWCL